MEVNLLSRHLQQLLLEQGIVPNVEAETPQGLTARQLADSGGHVAVQQLLNST